MLPSLCLILAAGVSAPGQNLSAACKIPARLPHIAGLGATIVYLSPLNVDSYPSVFGPTTTYEIKDYGVIDPESGTAAELKALVTEAHRLGLKVIMKNSNQDGVVSFIRRCRVANYLA